MWKNALRARTCEFEQCVSKGELLSFLHVQATVRADKDSGETLMLRDVSSKEKQDAGSSCFATHTPSKCTPYKAMKGNIQVHGGHGVVNSYTPPCPPRTPRYNAKPEEPLTFNLSKGTGNIVIKSPLARKTHQRALKGLARRDYFFAPPPRRRSIIPLKCSNGYAPRTATPFTKNAGVPEIS